MKSMRITASQFQKEYGEDGFGFLIIYLFAEAISLCSYDILWHPECQSISDELFTSTTIWLYLIGVLLFLYRIE